MEGNAIASRTKQPSLQPTAHQEGELELALLLHKEQTAEFLHLEAAHRRSDLSEEWGWQEPGMQWVNFHEVTFIVHFPGAKHASRCVMKKSLWLRSNSFSFLKCRIPLQPLQSPPPPHPAPTWLPGCFLLLQFSWHFLDFMQMGSYTMDPFVFDIFIWHGVLRCFVFFHDWFVPLLLTSILLHGMYVSRFVSPFTSRWASGFCPIWGCYEQHHIENSYAYISVTFNFHCSFIDTTRWNCWLIW